MKILDLASCDRADAVRAAADALLGGGVAVFPTDTVYGVAAHPDFPAALERIYSIKGRRPEKPIAFLASDASAPSDFGAAMPPRAQELVRRWPGAMTLVLDCPGGAAEGFRVPDSAIARDIIAACGGLLRVTSANFSGDPSPGCFDDIPASFLALCDVAVNGGPCPGGIPSEVIKITADGEETILRPATNVESRDSKSKILNPEMKNDN